MRYIALVVIGLALPVLAEHWVRVGEDMVAAALNDRLVKYESAHQVVHASGKTLLGRRPHQLRQLASQGRAILFQLTPRGNQGLL